MFLLSAHIWLPVFFGLLLLVLPVQDAKKLRTIALIGSSSTVLLTILLFGQFDPHLSTIQMEEYLPWITPLGISYRLGVDGLSLPLLALNSLLVWISIYSSSEQISRPRLYYFLLLILSGGIAGVFLAQNTLLFFLFYEVELIPLYLLISIWGGAKRGYAATKFLIFTALSGILLLAACYGMVGLSTSMEVLSFDFVDLETRQLSLGAQIGLLITLFLAFGIKIPLVPFHTWLPDAHVEASTPISVLLAGVLLKLGTYGILRFGLGLFPDAWKVLAPFLAAWAVFTVLYGCLTAITQSDMKRMVAFSSIGHMGFILLALAAATPVSLTGATMQMVSHGLISALLFLMVGVIYQKLGTRDLNALAGLFNPEKGLPIIGSLSVLGAMASTGIPGMVGFASELLIYRGSYSVFPVQTLLCMIGTGLTAVYFLILINKAFFGRLQKADIPPVFWRDRIPGILISLIVVYLGIQPQGFVNWIEATSQSLGLTYY